MKKVVKPTEPVFVQEHIFGGGTVEDLQECRVRLIEAAKVKGWQNMVGHVVTSSRAVVKDEKTCTAAMVRVATESICFLGRAADYPSLDDWRAKHAA